jgi:hypothetical protein
MIYDFNLNHLTLVEAGRGSYVRSKNRSYVVVVATYQDDMNLADLLPQLINDVIIYDASLFVDLPNEGNNCFTSA